MTGHRKVPLNVTAAGELQLGERYTEPPAPLVWTGDRRRCAVCGEPAMWRRPTGVRGAAVHPECETGYFDEVSVSVLAGIGASLMTGLGATSVSEGWHEPEVPPPESRRLGRADAGCELCRRPYAAYWIVAGTWRCAEHDTIRYPPRKRYWHQ